MDAQDQAKQKKGLANHPEETPLVVRQEGEDMTCLRTRTLKTLAKRAAKKNESLALQIVGFVLIAKNGWLVRKYADGKVEKVRKLVSHTSKRV